MLLEMVPNGGQEFFCHELAHGVARQDLVLGQHCIEVCQTVESNWFHTWSHYISDVHTVCDDLIVFILLAPPNK
jgi:hypothetical protein